MQPRLQIAITTGMELPSDEAAPCERQDFPVLRKPFRPAFLAEVDFSETTPEVDFRPR